MRFTYAESMCDPRQYAPLAIAAEEAGYHSFTVPDSIAYPETSDSEYPYTPDGDREFLDGKPFIEPFSLIPALGAVTRRLRFTTFVVKLPIRHPVLVAKQAASVAVLTGDRFGFGVGLSPWPDDFRITGTEWKSRGRRMDEMIDIIRGLTRPPKNAAADAPYLAGDYFAYRGEHYDVPSIRLCPVPRKPIPILIGGHADAALRRAARVGDGWMHAGGGQAADLGAALARLADLRTEYGREREPFEIHVISLDGFTPDGVRRLEDQGVTDAIVGFRNAYAADDQTLDHKLTALRRFAEQVIARVGG
jgi:probable F420-dependent oxidoreductase